WRRPSSQAGPPTSCGRDTVSGMDENAQRSTWQRVNVRSPCQKKQVGRCRHSRVQRRRVRGEGSRMTLNLCDGFDEVLVDSHEIRAVFVVDDNFGEADE